MVKLFQKRFPTGTQGTRKPGYYMDGLLYDNLGLTKEVIKKDWDMAFVIDGAEGSGKSVIAQQMAYYCDPSLTLDRVTFRPDAFKDAVLKAGKYNAVVFDEAYGGLNSKRALMEVNTSLVDMMTEIRQKNLFIYIVLPSYFDLVKYLALWRTRMLVHVYAKKFDRGYFKFFSYNKKKELYVKGKKYYDYKCVKPDFQGRFTNFYTVDKEKYKAKKWNSLRAYNKDSKDVQTKTEIIAETTKKIALNIYNAPKFNLTKQDVAKLMGVARQTVYRYLN